MTPRLLLVSPEVWAGPVMSASEVMATEPRPWLGGPCVEVLDNPVIGTIDAAIADLLLEDAAARAPADATSVELRAHDPCGAERTLTDFLPVVTRTPLKSLSAGAEPHSTPLTASPQSCWSGPSIASIAACSRRSTPTRASARSST